MNACLCGYTLLCVHVLTTTDDNLLLGRRRYAGSDDKHSDLPEGDEVGGEEEIQECTYKEQKMRQNREEEKKDVQRG